MEFLKFVEAHIEAFWALPAACFLGAAVLFIIHKRRQQ